MRKVFVRTRNVKNFIAMMETILWWAAQNDAAYIRAANKMTNRWLLEEIVTELGESPYYRSSDLFHQCITSLLQEPKILIVDEIDYLAGDNEVIETLRDIHDKTDVPVILVGMGSANRKLMRYRHLFDRITEVLRFEPFTLSDIEMIIHQLCEVVLTECAVKVIFSKSNRFRQIVRLISRAEYLAEANGLTTLDGITLQEILKHDNRENTEDC